MNLTFFVKISSLFLLLAFLLSLNFNCVKISKENKETNSNLELTKIQINGLAVNRKGGAVIDSKSIHYWLEGKSSWEDNLLGKKVSAKGLLKIREDNPVYLEDSETISQGIPVSTESELKERKKRFWIIDYKVSVIE